MSSKIDVFDWNADGSRELIGLALTTTKQLLSGANKNYNVSHALFLFFLH
jgi:hypothetical protein